MHRGAGSLAQSFEHEPTELAFVDLLAAVDGALRPPRGAR